MPSHRAQSVPLSPIKQMEQLSRQVSGAISLAQGIPHFPPSRKVLRVVTQALLQGKGCHYTLPEGLYELRQAISRHIFERTGCYFSPKGEILVTAGAMAALQATLAALLDPGEEVLVLSPAYASYYSQIRAVSAVPVSIPVPSSGELPLDLLEKKVSQKTKALLFAHPSNPTGVFFSREKLERLVSFARVHNLYLITDEVYFPFVWEGKFVSLAEVPEARERLVLIFSFSKAHSITGFRIGYLAAPAFLAHQILKFHDNLITCAPHPAQLAALAILQGGDEEFSLRLSYYHKQREFAFSLFQKLSYVEVFRPKAGYYLFLRILKGKVDSLALSKALLTSAKVATVPGIAFGECGEGHLRISFAVEKERLKKGFERLAPYLENLEWLSSFVRPCRQAA